VEGKAKLARRTPGIHVRTQEGSAAYCNLANVSGLDGVIVAIRSAKGRNRYGNEIRKES